MSALRGRDASVLDVLERVALVGAALAAVMVVLSLVHPDPRTEIPVRAAGALLGPAQEWAQDYEGAHRGVRVAVGCAGPEGTLAALLNGSADLAVLDRRIRADEDARFVRRFGASAHEVAVTLGARPASGPGIAYLYTAAEPAGALAGFIHHIATRAGLALAGLTP